MPFYTGSRDMDSRAHGFKHYKNYFFRLFLLFVDQFLNFFKNEITRLPDYQTTRLLYHYIMKKSPLFFLVILLITSCNSEGQHTYTNALIKESSPYLLQHAHNPVNWYPWNEEALKKAQDENKLMVISVGYAACHWCHVMEEESFQDTAVANLMNQHFISIKVDREERPDVDDVYMTACQLASNGNCGWPLNALALPDGRPIWAGTYFPKKQWMEILGYFIEIKDNQADKLENYAQRLLDGIQQLDSYQIPGESSELNKEHIENVAAGFLKRVDFKDGGIAGQLKFPMPVSFEFLLDYHAQDENERVLEAAELTLKKMALGGIFDHLAGGFARYSTDEKWMVPHFEKMLYDNAQLVSLYAHTFQITKNPLYENVIHQTLNFIENELTSPEGGFYSSINADSEGEEGKFYVWRKEEIDQLITDPIDNKLISDHFDIKKNGNWEEGKNVLAVRKSVQELANQNGLSVEQVTDKLRASKKTLFEARKKRIAPSLDDKILSSWNALMISGYVDAFKALGEQKYLEKAIKAGQFLAENLLKGDGQLYRNHKEGVSSIDGFLDDYALLIQAFLDLYQVSFDTEWLNKAKLLNDYVLQHFQDPSSPLLYYTSDLSPPLITRKKELDDNVIPASNSIMAHNFYQLGLILYDTALVNKSKSMLNLMINNMGENPDAVYYGNWFRLYLGHLNPTKEVVIIGPDFAKKRDLIQHHFFPNAIFLGGAQENELPLLQNKFVAGKTMIYVCENKVCKLPVEEVEEALKLME